MTTAKKPHGKRKPSGHVHEFQHVTTFLCLFTTSRRTNGLFERLECKCGASIERKLS